MLFDDDGYGDIVECSGDDEPLMLDIWDPLQFKLFDTGGGDVVVQEVVGEKSLGGLVASSTVKTDFEQIVLADG